MRRSQTIASAAPGLIVVSFGLVLAALPIFMVGGLAVQIRAELGFSEAALGAAVTTGFVVGALAAPFGGRIADHIGAKAAVLIGSGLATLALLGLGLMTNSWTTLAVFLAITGLGVAITDPGLAIVVSRSIAPERHGSAFGLKEASIPAATLAAGIAVPAIALTVGWRWAFAVGALPLLVVLLLLPRLDVTDEPLDDSVPEDDSAAPLAVPKQAIFLTAIAAALGTAAASGVGVFLTESAVAMGISPGGAGVLLAVGSVAGIVTRIVTGVMADRTGREQLRVIAGMLIVGGVAIALGATGANPLLVVGTIGAFSGGWGWTGLYFLSLVRAVPSAPGTVAGIGTAGLGVGNAAGPILFGLAAQSYSFGVAWTGAAIAASLAGVMMLVARWRFAS